MSILLFHYSKSGVIFIGVPVSALTLLVWVRARAPCFEKT